MPDPETDSALMPSVGRLVRGLSALFWGLPVALVISIQTATTSWLSILGMTALFGPLASMALLLYGLWLVGHFQPQERIWMAAVDRAKLFALLNLGLSPFLYWHRRFADVSFFSYSVGLMAFSGIAFLFSLNALMRRLAAMLPDETLRMETAVFTTLNSTLLILLPAFVLGDYLLTRFADLPFYLRLALELTHSLQFWLRLFLVLMPVAVTMSLLWKIKEVILMSVFRASDPAEP